MLRTCTDAMVLVQPGCIWLPTHMPRMDSLSVFRLHAIIYCSPLKLGGVAAVRTSVTDIRGVPSGRFADW